MPWTKFKTYFVLIAALPALIWLAWNLSHQLILSKDQAANTLPLSPEFKDEWDAFCNEQNIQKQETYDGWTLRISHSNPVQWSFWITNLQGLTSDQAYALLQNPPVDSLIRDVTMYWNSGKPEVKKAKRDVFHVLSRHHSLIKITQNPQIGESSDSSGSSVHRADSLQPPSLRIIGMVGLFRYQTALTDSTIWLGLDMFMDQDYRYYPSVEHLYQYQRRKTHPDYLPVAVARTLAEDWVEHHVPPSHQNRQTLLDFILEEGHILACMRWMLPDAHDSLLLGYSSSQWDWIQQHQDEVWKDIISKDLLFSGDPAVIARYLNDGPFSSGYSPQSPPALGMFYGDAIVQKWIMNQPQSNTRRAWDLLMKQNNSESARFLKNSGYRGRD
jgi:hypothetical protein